MTKYPGKIDTDAELPRITDNISEIGSDSLNAMREAIIAIQDSLGTNPQGTTSTLVNRMSASINDDGTLKASALLAAGLIALPITNSMISATAAVEESKLDLDFATQTLQDEISSNDVDIANLQDAIANLIYKFNQHVAGLAHRHETSHVDLTTALSGISATDLDAALVSMNTRFLNHVSPSASGAHAASNISVDTTSLTIVSPSSNNVQLAIEDLDRIRKTLFEVHRDEMHANGFSNWANNVDGYNTYNKKFPSGLTQTSTGNVVVGTRNAFEVDGYSLQGSGVEQGDILLIKGGGIAGQYVIDDVGPRPAIGTKPELLSDQLEISGTFNDGYEGIIQESYIFGSSSTFDYKASTAPTIHQSDIRVDSVQIARPNSAKVLSLGFNTLLIDSASTLDIEVGLGGTATTRSISVDNLHFDRSASPAIKVTLDTIIERLNYVFQNRVDGNAFPVAAYRVGDELMLSHNFLGNEEVYLKILGTGNANFTLGLDGYGADVVDKKSFPTKTNYFYVNGKRFTDVGEILSTLADVSGQVFMMPSGVNPLTSGVKVGNLLHLRSHSDSSPLTTPIGTYFIIDVDATSITIHSSSGVPVDTNVSIEIFHDALGLNDFNTNTRKQVIECFLTPTGSVAYNERLSYENTISNLSIVDVSDNYQQDDVNLVVTATSSKATLKLGEGVAKDIPLDFSGKINLYGQSNVEYITILIESVVGIGTANVVINPHVSEEENLEVCSVKIDGALTVSNIVDKRLYGSVGIDEVREDYTQAYIEMPWSELRSNGVVHGFDILLDNNGSIFSDGYIDPALFPNNQGIVILGGTAYVSGARCDVVTTGINFPNEAGQFSVVLNQLGKFDIVNTTDYNLSEIIDGYGGEIIPIASVVHDGYLITSAEDRRFFINELDDKVDLVLDMTNRRIGHFDTVDSALSWIESYPYSEKFTLTYVSDLPNDDLVIRQADRDITIFMDGRIGNLTVNTPCRITGRGLSNRGKNHVDGYLIIGNNCTEINLENLSLSAVDLDLSINSNIKFTNCFFDGYSALSSEIISSLGGGSGTLVFEKCKFDSLSNGIKIGFGNRDVSISDCEFSGQGSMVVTGNNVSITNSILNNSGFSITSVNHVLVSNSIFKNNLVTSSTPALKITSKTASITENTFVSFSTAGAGVVVIDVLGVTNSAFSDNYISGELLLDAILISSNGIVENNKFDSLSSLPTSIISCNRFAGNEITNPVTTDMLISTVIAHNNTGLMSVKSKSPSKPLELVSENKFVNSSQGVNVDLSSSSGNIIISANVFKVAGPSAMTMVSVGLLGDILISDNIFEGGIGDLGIQLGANTGVKVVSSNVFKGVAPCIETTSSIDSLTLSSNIIGGNITLSARDNIIVSDNTFYSSISFTDNVDSFIFEGNWAEGGDIIFSGSSVANLQMSNNNIDNLLLQIGSEITDSIISNNIVGLTVSTSFSAFKTVFSENIVNGYTNVSNIVFSNSSLSQNIFKGGGDVEFTLLSSGGGIDSNTFIEDNIFEGTGSTVVSIGSTDPVRSFGFSGNSTFGTGIVFRTNSFINNSIISDNLNFMIHIANGASTSTISGCTMPNNELEINGLCSSLLVSSNLVSTLTVDCNSPGGLAITNNFCSGDIFVLSGSVGVRSITKAVISGNYALGDITFLSDSNDPSSILSLKKCFITLNTAQSMRVASASLAPGSLASYTIEGCKFESNNIGLDIDIFNATENLLTASSFSFIDNSFETNIVDGYFNISQSNLAGAARTVEGLSVSGNSIGESIVISGDTEFSGARFNNNNISKGIYWTLETLSASYTNSDISFFGNVVGEDIRYSVAPPLSSGSVNTISKWDLSRNNIGGRIVIEVYDKKAASSIPIVIISGLNISGNTLSRVDITVDIEGASSLLYYVYDSLNIQNNNFVSSGSNGGIVNKLTMNSLTSLSDVTLKIANSLWANNSSLVLGSVLNHASFNFIGVSANVYRSKFVIDNSSIVNNTTFSWDGDTPLLIDTSVYGNKFSYFELTSFNNSQLISNTFDGYCGLALGSSICNSNRVGGALYLESIVASIFSENVVDSFVGSGMSACTLSSIQNNQFLNSGVELRGSPVSELSVSNNTILDNDLSILAGSSISELSISNNILSNGRIRVQANTNIDKLILSNNVVSGTVGVSGRITTIGVDVTNLSILGNFAETMIDVNGSGEITDMNVADNIIEDALFVDAALGRVLRCKVSGNTIAGNSSLYLGTASTLRSFIAVSNNLCLGDFTINCGSSSKGRISVISNQIGVGLTGDLVIANTGNTFFDNFVISDNQILGDISLPTSSHTLRNWIITGNNLEGSLNFGSSGATIENLKLANNYMGFVVILALTQFSGGVNKSVFFANHAITWTSSGSGDINLYNQNRILPIGNTSSTDPLSPSRILFSSVPGSFSAHNTNSFTGVNTSGGQIVII